MSTTSDGIIAPCQEPWIVTAWNNGIHHESGAGYGLKILPADRDRFFRREWSTVLLDLEGESQPIACNIDKDSFWIPVCRELISADIGRWLKKNGLAPWKKGSPPKLHLAPIAGNRFRLHHEQEVRNAA